MFDFLVTQGLSVVFEQVHKRWGAIGCGVAFLIVLAIAGGVAAFLFFLLG
jgi:hypothetical protein